MKKLICVAIYVIVPLCSLVAQNDKFVSYDHTPEGLIQTLGHGDYELSSLTPQRIELVSNKAMFSYQFYQDRLGEIVMEKNFVDLQSCEAIYEGWMRFFRYKKAELVETISDQKAYRHLIFANQGEVFVLMVKAQQNGSVLVKVEARYIAHLPMHQWGPYEALAYPGALNLEAMLASKEIIAEDLRSN